MKVGRKHCFHKLLLVSALSLLICSSCVPGEHSFLMVQLCLGNEGGVSRFKQTLQAIAHDEGMRYTDGSDKTARNLRTMGVTKKNMHADGNLVHVGIHGDSGPGLTAGNMGLNTYDVAIGFSRGGDIKVARAFSNRVLERLKKQWELKLVPEGSGAFPDPACVQEPPPNNSFKPNPLRGSA